MTDHRGDPADGIESVGGSARPVSKRQAELSGDPRLDPLFPNRDARQRVPAVAISGQIPVMRVGVVEEPPPAVTDDQPVIDPVRADGASNGSQPRATVAPEREVEIELEPEPDVRPTQQVTLAPPSEPAAVPVPPRVVAPSPARRVRAERAASRTTPRRRSKPRVRRVRRVVRSVDTWTVFKVSAIFYLVAYVIVLVAGVLLWNLANTTGTVDNVERFFESFGWDSFEFKGGEIFHAYWIIGLFLVVAGTGLNVTLSVLFNLIADLVGGIGLTVLEEEVRVVRAEEHRPAGDEETFDADVWNDVTGSVYRPEGN